MFRLCWAKYIVDKKINGYYLWERVAPFVYAERLSGVNSLVDFFVKDDIRDVAEHILTKEQAKEMYSSDDNKNRYKSHIERTIESTRSEEAFFDYGTFDNFITEFTKIELNQGWKRNPEFPESFFSKKSKVHANLILFDETYMIMKTLKDYIKFREFIKEKTLEFDDKKMKVDKWSNHE